MKQERKRRRIEDEDERRMDGQMEKRVDKVEEEE